MAKPGPKPKILCIRGHTLALTRDKLGRCYECILIRAREWRARNPSYMRLRNWRVQGIDLDYSTYQKMEKEQGGLCAICRRPPDGRGALHVDHNRQTNAVRQLLCSTCNVQLGVYERRATEFANYLARHARKEQS